MFFADSITLFMCCLNVASEDKVTPRSFTASFSSISLKVGDVGGIVFQFCVCAVAEEFKFQVIEFHIVCYAPLVDME